MSQPIVITRELTEIKYTYSSRCLYSCWGEKSYQGKTTREQLNVKLWGIGYNIMGILR